MARPLRIEYPGAGHPVTSRGAGGVSGSRALRRYLEGRRGRKKEIWASVPPTQSWLYVEGDCGLFRGSLYYPEQGDRQRNGEQRLIGGQPFVSFHAARITLGKHAGGKQGAS